MKQELNLGKNVQTPEFWLLAIAGGLIAIHFSLIWKLSGVFSIQTLIFWIAALVISWKHRYTLNLKSDVFSTFLGLILIIWILFRSSIYDGSVDIIGRISPMISFISLVLLASGFKEFAQYWREFILVLFTVFPSEHILNKFPIIDHLFTHFDAKISSFFLWYVGFDVVPSGNKILLPNQEVLVAFPCSSYGLIISLLQIAVVYFLLFNSSRKYLPPLLLGIILISVTINNVRIGALAVFAANDNQVAFDYWHGSQGAEIASTIAIFSFAFLIKLLNQNQHEKMESN